VLDEAKAIGRNRLKQSHLWIGLVVTLTLTLTLAAGCGSDNGGGPTPTPSPQNPVPAGFRAVALAADGFLSGNEVLLASLEVLGPLMGTSLRRGSEDPMRPTEGAIQQSCIPFDAQNKVFKYDTLTAKYVPTSDPGAPPDGARFVLYELNASGGPMLPLDQHEIGFFDVHCEGQFPNIDSLTVGLVNTMDQPGDVEVLRVALKGTVDPRTPPTIFNFGRSVGVMHDPRTGNTTDIAVLAEGTVGSSLKESFEITGGLEAFDSGLAGFAAGSGRWDTSLGSSGLPEPPLNSYNTHCTMKDASRTELFGASLDMTVDSSGKIVNVNAGGRAPLEFADIVGSESGILACFSGEYVDPLIEGAGTNDGCATGTIDTAIPQPAQALDTYFDGYVALLDLLNVMTRIYGISAEVLTP
jgi:hypothetical protein